MDKEVPHTPEAPEDGSLLTVAEAVATLRISRSHFFKMKRQGIIQTVKLGPRTAVPRREIMRLIDEALADGAPPGDRRPGQLSTRPKDVTNSGGRLSG